MAGNQSTDDTDRKYRRWRVAFAEMGDAQRRTRQRLRVAELVSCFPSCRIAAELREPEPLGVKRCELLLEWTRPVSRAVAESLVSDLPGGILALTRPVAEVTR